MALPTSMTSGGVRLWRAGFRIAAFPTDPTFWSEVQCSSSTSFPTSRTRILKQPPTGGNTVISTFEVPYSTRTFYARTRHFKTGYTTGAWTTLVSGKPYYLPNRLPDPGFYAHHVSQFGQLTTAFKKTVRVPFLSILPASTAGSFITIGDNAAGPRATNTLSKGSVGLIFPLGVTLTQVRAQLQRAHATDTAIVSLNQASPLGAVTLLATLTCTTGAAFRTITSSNFSSLVASNDYYLILQLKGSTAQLSAQALWAEVDYTMPHLGAAY